MDLTIGIAVTVALVVGFAAGLLTFKRASQWCGHCGLTKVCPQCTDGATQVSRSEHLLPSRALPNLGTTARGSSGEDNRLQRWQSGR